MIVEEIKGLLQPILEQNGISNDTQYITFEWFNTHFKECLNQIELNERI